MKYVAPRPYADPEVAARKIVELANAVEPYFDNRILIEKINGPFLYELRGTPAEYKAGLDRAKCSPRRRQQKTRPGTRRVAGLFGVCGVDAARLVV